MSTIQKARVILGWAHTCSGSTLDPGSPRLDVVEKKSMEPGMLKSSSGIVIRSHRMSSVPSMDHVSCGLLRGLKTKRCKQVLSVRSSLIRI